MFFYVHLPIVDMRESPTFASKVVSQAIFGEPLQSQKEEGEWSLVNTPDDYTGWIPSSSYIRREAPYEKAAAITRLKAHVYRTPDIEYGPLATLPYGASLSGIRPVDARWSKVVFLDGKDGYIQNGDIATEHCPRKKEDLPAFGLRFLGLPYTWGGRSSFGYDCSGLIQMLYGKIGIGLPRDARQQILDPRFKTILLSELEAGDLIFWGKSEHQILHVGMYIGEGKFLHTSSRECLPWCRISNLTDPEWSGRADAYSPLSIGRQLIDPS